MAEADQTDTVFIDVASGSGQYPITVDSNVDSTVDSTVDNEPTKEEKSISASPLDPYLVIQARRVRCQECRFTAETEEKMLRHVRKIHRGENPFQCYMCDYSTYNKVLFEEHVRIHQGIKPYKCTHCPYRSVSKKNTKKHEQIHRPDNPHKCEQCGFIARHLRSLKHHLLTHGQTTIVECTQCKESFADSVLYRNHRKSRKRCSECQKMICVRYKSQHLLEEHGIAKKKRKSVKEPKKYLFVCAICQWEGNSKPRILLHLIHHPHQAVDEDVVDTHVLKQLGIMQD